MTIGYEQEYQLRTGDFDTRADLMPSSVLDIFQDIAGVNADETPGMGFQEMLDAGLFWAVVQIKYEVLKRPRLHQRVLARTWPLAPTRMGCQREYTLSAVDGEPLVRGDSQWIMMDLATRSFVSAKEVYKEDGEFSQEKVFEKKTRRLRDFEATTRPHDMACGYCDIDVNGHVNNTKYANFFLDAWNPGEDEHIRTFQIDYRHEVHAGEELQIFAERADSENAVLGKGVGADGEARFFCKAELAG